MPRWVYDPKLGKHVSGGRKGKAAGGGGGKVRLTTRMDLIGDWERCLTDMRALDLPKAIEKAIRQEVALAERMMKENLTKGGQPAGAPFAALSPWTLAARRLAKPPIKGTKALMARGDMRNAITHVVFGRGAEAVGFAGVLRQTKSGRPGGAPMVNIAAVHEFGKTIVVRMTPKMIRFLAVLAKEAKMPAKTNPGGAGTAGNRFLVIHIPARPFIRPVFALWSKDAPARFMKRVAHFTNGTLGDP